MATAGTTLETPKRKEGRYKGARGEEENGNIYGITHRSHTAWKPFKGGSICTLQKWKHRGSLSSPAEHDESPVQPETQVNFKFSDTSSRPIHLMKKKNKHSLINKNTELKKKVVKPHLNLCHSTLCKIS